MSTQQVKAFLFMEEGTDYTAAVWEAKWTPHVWPFLMDESDTRVFIKEITVPVEVPDDFDPIGRQIAALEKQKQEALETYQRTVAGINGRLSKLQAITYEASPA